MVKLFKAFMLCQIDHDFVIDMRTFKNFEIVNEIDLSQTTTVEENGDSYSPSGIEVQTIEILSR
jgi:hypothetical protein